MNSNDNHTLSIKKKYEAISGMRMKNREKGNIANTEKFNILCGWWLSGKMKMININNGLTIKRGCVVKIGA